MTAIREALYLPLLFLTVTLLGGVRIADRVSLIPPPVFTLVLAAVLLGVLVKCGALVPERLMRADRPSLAEPERACRPGDHILCGGAGIQPRPSRSRGCRG